MTTGEKRRRIHVVDNDEAVRDSLEALLEHHGFDVQTHGSSTDFLETSGSVTEAACLLLDIRRPGLDGLQVLTRIVERNLPLAVIMITGHADVPTAVRAMKTGAVDFIEKPFTQDTILTAVGKAFDSLGDDRSSGTEAPEITERISNLSPRERDVLVRLVDGLTNKEIAREFEISPRTIEVYRAGVMEKMAARNLSTLVKMELAAGLGKGLS